MQLIKPKQISGEIMTLFDDADKKVIIVSPYYKVEKWYKLRNCFDDLKRRNIEVEFYVRENEWESINELKAIGFAPISIPNLHTKLYLNEKYAIVSSMNLLLSSDNNSLDIALKTETEAEYEQLYQYYTRYIKATPTQKREFVRPEYNDWREELERALASTFNRKVYINERENALQINVRNKYEAFIHNGKSNNLRISGILSSKEYEFTSNNLNIFHGSKMSIELQAGGKGYYDTIWGTINGLKSWSINDLHKDDEKTVVDAIVKFIAGIEQLKSLVI
ncbi:hypothetical protein OCK74_14870 [Chitinophagaceae bacterium LB-8]|uniref:Phospholipase D-like domain-containing protein n=1 Tax=Paraflavisolibacter caeni TaxID=2982496 RepID=A0A9X3B8Z1_9BACT|nr:hypothetical protein [Paraflavisolibacter caeni]MCU7550401.1 hypothetical protein [Paraflavisolibacter caeni]